MATAPLTASTRDSALSWLHQETRALLTRLDRVKPFALQETMVPAAAPTPTAQVAIDRYLVQGRRELRSLINAYLRWLSSPEGRAAPATEAQRRFVFLRMRFNTVLSQLDIFADVLTQRSEHENGVWLAGLDALAADALVLPDNYFQPPPVICYLDRGHGAAIRRARTRLPGGGENPVAIIRVPRERMVSNGIASSLVHEVGHQGAALLGLVRSLRPVLARMEQAAAGQAIAWRLWNRWISEILSDLWSVARVGIAATSGLMGVVSLPRPFVFRLALDDPHPVPWIRARLSAAMGKALYPHPQWDRISAVWEAYYPLAGLDGPRRQLFALVEATVPDFVDLLVSHRPASLRGRSLGEVLASPDRHPERLRAFFQAWRRSPNRLGRAAPSLVFAAIGQARADGRIDPAEESQILAWLLPYWTIRGLNQRAMLCAAGTGFTGVALAA